MSRNFQKSLIFTASAGMGLPDQSRHQGMSGYDAFYQKLITNFDLATVTGFFSMEAIIDNRPVDLTRLR